MLEEACRVASAKVFSNLTSESQETANTALAHHGPWLTVFLFVIVCNQNQAQLGIAL